MRGARITAPRSRCDIADHIDRLDRTPRMLANEPIDRIDQAEPTDPIEPTDPMLPMESTEPTLPIDRADLWEAMLR